MKKEPKTKLVGGGISHESCTFITRFIPGRWRGKGQEALDHFRGKRSNLSGMIDICEREGVELIPTTYGSPDSKGRVLNESYYSLLNPMLEGTPVHRDAVADGLMDHLSGVPAGLAQ